MNALCKTGLLAALVSAVIAIPAKAQDAPKNISLEVGANYVMDSDVRDAVGDVGWRVGLGYNLPTKGFLSPTTSRPSVNLSYAQNKDGDNKLTVWGLMYEERVPFGMQDSYAKTRPYWGLGVGINFLDAEAETVIGEVPTVVANQFEIDGSEDATNLGLRAMLGMEFSANYYLEASYNWTQDVADADGNSIALVIGGRF